MSHLVPCPSCQRHVRHVETACPFCGAAVELASTPAPQMPRTRLSRAATFAFGATLVGAALGACGGESEGGGNTGGQSSAGQNTGGSSHAGTSNDSFGGSAQPVYGAPDPGIGGGVVAPTYGGPPATGGGPVYGAPPVGGSGLIYGGPPSAGAGGMGGTTGDNGEAGAAGEGGAGGEFQAIGGKNGGPQPVYGAPPIPP